MMRSSERAVDELNRRVTEAILAAEAAPATEAAQAWVRVALAERELAEVHAAATDEGALARVGQVAALVRARLPSLAWGVAEEYLEDAALPAERAAELRELVAGAAAELPARLGATVRGVRWV